MWIFYVYKNIDCLRNKSIILKTKLIMYLYMVCRTVSGMDGQVLISGRPFGGPTSRSVSVGLGLGPGPGPGHWLVLAINIAIANTTIMRVTGITR